MTRTVTEILLSFFVAGCGPVVAGESDETETAPNPTSGDTTAPRGSTSSGPNGTASTTADGSDGSTSLPPGGSTTNSGTTTETPGEMRCPSPATDPADLLGVTTRPLQGDPDAVVTIVEWLGYEDPYSRMVEPKVQVLLASEHAVRRVVRQQPFNFHPNARMLAEAAVAADVQGAFWPLHDALMSFRGTLDAEALDTIAQGVGLDVDQLHVDMASAATASILAEDETVLVNLVGQGATPTFFINGHRIDGNQPIEIFEQYVATEAEATQALLDGGYTLCEAYAERLEENLGG